jgi:chromate transporter
MFFKLGLTSFGGGYAMIPLMKQEILILVTSLGVDQSVLDRFANLIAVSQITPGPIAINAAAYIGFICSGFIGAVISVIGIILPAFLIMLTIAHYFERFKASEAMSHLLMGIRPATVGLILASITVFADGSIFTKQAINFQLIDNLRTQLFSIVNPAGIIIFVLAFVAAKKFKVAPIPITIAAGILGAFLYQFI